MKIHFRCLAVFEHKVPQPVDDNMFLSLYNRNVNDRNLSYITVKLEKLSIYFNRPLMNIPNLKISTAENKINFP